MVDHKHPLVVLSKQLPWQQANKAGFIGRA
jgi:hypothetical protein